MNNPLARRRIVVLAFALLFLAALPAPGWSQTAPPSTDLPGTVMREMSRGNFQEALQLAREAVAEAPGDLERQYILGIAYARAGRPEEAESIFRALIEADLERYRKAYFDLSGVELARGREAEALRALEEARPLDPGRADYESAIVYMRLKQFEKASELLKRAAILKPELAVEATIQRAIAEYQLKHYSKARELLREVKKMSMPPEKARQVEALLKDFDAAMRANRPWYLAVTLGYQYDSNVLQNPLGQVGLAPAAQARQQHDSAVLANLLFRYNLYDQAPWRFGVAYNHYQLTYFDNDDLSLLGLRPSLYLQWERAPYFLTFEYMFSYFWTGSDPSVIANAFMPRFVMLHGDHFRTEVYSGAEVRSRMDDTPDDSVYLFGLTEMYLMRGGKAHLRAGYILNYDDMVPDERADFASHQVFLGTQWPIWVDRWFVDVSGSLIWRDYSFDPLISEENKRRDNEQDLNLMVFGPLTQRLQLNVLYQYIWNNSNITNNQGYDPYHYRRAVLTCMLTYTF